MVNKAKRSIKKPIFIANTTNSTYQNLDASFLFNNENGKTVADKNIIQNANLYNPVALLTIAEP